MPLAPFVRVRDTATKHEYDVRADSVLIRTERVLVIKTDRFPPSATMRPPKHHIPSHELVRPPASRPTPEPSGDGKPNTKEN